MILSFTILTKILIAMAYTQKRPIYGHSYKFCQSGGASHDNRRASAAVDPSQPRHPSHYPLRPWPARAQGRVMLWATRGPKALPAADPVGSAWCQAHPMHTVCLRTPGAQASCFHPLLHSAQGRAPTRPASSRAHQVLGPPWQAGMAISR